MGSTGSLKYRVLLGLKGIPAHVWGMSAAERILGSNCAKLEPALATVDGEDRHEFVITAWSIRPNFIPQEKLIGIPEPELPYVIEPPLHPSEHEVIRSKLTVLWYCVRIRVIEV